MNRSINAVDRTSLCSYFPLWGGGSSSNTRAQAAPCMRKRSAAGSQSIDSGLQSKPIQLHFLSFNRFDIPILVLASSPRSRLAENPGGAAHSDHRVHMALLRFARSLSSSTQVDASSKSPSPPPASSIMRGRRHLLNGRKRTPAARRSTLHLGTARRAG